MKLSNKILLYVEYGSPGDGCHWRWSICGWNEAGQEGNGDFYDLNSWGSKGLLCEDQALDYIKDNNFKGKNKLEVRDSDGYPCDIKDSAECILFDPTSERICNKIKKYFREEMSYHILDALYEGDIESKFYMECKCGEHMIYPEEMHSTSYHGDGGIGIISTNYVCSECYCNYSCSYCGEYCGDGELYHQLENGSVGECCIEDQLEEAIKDQTQDLENAMSQAYKPTDKPPLTRYGKKTDAHSYMIKLKEELIHMEAMRAEIEECIKTGELRDGKDVPCMYTRLEPPKQKETGHRDLFEGDNAI